jgi:hypothetical protein
LDAIGGLGGYGVGIAIAGAGVIYYGHQTGQAIAELNIDLTPPPDNSLHTIPDNPPLEIPVIAGIPAPVEPPWTDDYSSVAAPPLEIPMFMTARGDSTKLAENMIGAGMERPAETAAHHIVASSDPRAAFARGVLSGVGININDAKNGVFLPRFLSSRNPEEMDVHSTIHTNLYYETLNRRLSGLTTQEEVIAALEAISQELQNGTFPH